MNFKSLLRFYVEASDIQWKLSETCGLNLGLLNITCDAKLLKNQLFLRGLVLRSYFLTSECLYDAYLNSHLYTAWDVV